jgi:N-acetylneuraminic acid mutarotase
VSVSVRAFIGHFCCPAIACLLWAGAPPTLCSPEARKKPSSTTLTFAERVANQRAIEEVRWRHRIWPKENSRPKPPLEAIISKGEIEQKVNDYLRKSQLIADQRGRPITATELQAEMERMAGHTKQPDVLREFFAALGNDPFVIAECLARPIVADRLIPDPTVVAGVSPVLKKLFAADAGASTENQIRATSLDKAAYKLPEISTDCADDTWSATTTVNAPDVRSLHTVVWTGSEMIVWGGYNPSILNTGARYDPATDSWVATSTTNAPTGRVLHSAVWTGSEMIVWGGQAPSLLNTGGRYNPATDSWTATSTVNAPSPRIQHTAIWTGSEMIVWGGTSGNAWFNTGAKYDPNTDSWTATSTINAPERRWYHTAEWTGSEMIVWGGTNQTIYLNTGGRYNPSTDSWTSTGLTNAPLGRIAHTGVRGGSEMIVWGGVDSTFNDCNTGGRYDPSTDGWMGTSIGTAPSPRDSHTAVWTGSEMIVWGGLFGPPYVDFNTGGRYNPGIDSWIATSIANAPFPRNSHTAVWTGSEMIVWGGYNFPDDLYFNTGGRYCAASAPTPTPTPTPTPRVSPTPRLRPTPRRRPTPHPHP